MFPVSSHLLRTSVAPEDGTLATVGDPSSSSTTDAVLDILQPLFSAEGSSSIQTISETRRTLERAVHANKANNHSMIVNNFPQISTHIRQSDQLYHDHAKIRKTLSSLESQIDSSEPATSFIPPLLNLLQRHYTAQTNLMRSRTQINALRSLSGHVDRLRELESAVYGGRGADDWVIVALGFGGNGAVVNEEVLAGTKIMRAIQARMELFKSMVTEQVSDGFGKAISLTSPNNGEMKTILGVQSQVVLQQPRIPLRDNASSTITPTRPPPYTLNHIYKTLKTLHTLSKTLKDLSNRIIRDMIKPLLTERMWKVTRSENEGGSTIRLEQAGTRVDGEILQDVAAILDFVSTTTIPPDIPESAERGIFLRELHQTTSELILHDLIITSLPPTLDGLPKWLEIVNLAAENEAKSSERRVDVIGRFGREDVGREWANGRRRLVGEEVRSLILDGWGGWEGVEKVLEREMVDVEEVEVDDEDEGILGGNGHVEGKEDVVMKEVSKGDVEEEGWGWDETPLAGPSSPRNTKTSTSTTQNTNDEGDGWDFDAPQPINKPDLTPPTQSDSPTAPIVKPAKPAREAKRLGKKVAKAKAVKGDNEDDDPWGSTDVSEVDSRRSSMSVIDRPGTPPLPTNVEKPASGGDDWGWDEPSRPSISPTPPKSKRKVLKEINKIIHERYTVSTACDELLAIAQRVSNEIEQLQTVTFSSTSFSPARPILQATNTDIFALYRSLLPIHFAPQIASSPQIGFQTHNDAMYLSTLSGDDGEKMRGLAEWVLEGQLDVQRRGLDEGLDDLEWGIVGEEVGGRKVERGVRGLVHNLESLGRVIKPILPISTTHQVLGHLVDHLVLKLGMAILEMSDITEVESVRIGEIFGIVRGLEGVFGGDSEEGSRVVALVPHWLKFCYISEILQANLVDITYLYETGALVDFKTDELVGLIRALFADSEKRDGLVEKIESGMTVSH